MEDSGRQKRRPFYKWTGHQRTEQIYMKEQYVDLFFYGLLCPAGHECYSKCSGR